ncbi:MAG: hypothetical protein AABY00_00445 [Nanoarchaeota archaeon]
MIVPSSFQRMLLFSEKKLSRLFSDRLFCISSFVIVYTVLLFSFIIPLLLQNEMIMWDHAGLYFSVWYEKIYVFPDIFSWNPYFYAGYAHNQFYPPLYTYLAAALSYVFSIVFSLRIMLTITLLLTPISFYVFGKSFGLSKGRSAILMLLMFALLFLFPTSYYGGNFSSTFKIGLVTHAFGMMLFFFYISSLVHARRVGSIILPTFLFTLIILSHIVAAVAAGIVLLSFLFLYAREYKFRTFLYKHITLTFLLTSFWTLPFLAKQQHMTVIHLANNANISLLLAYALGFALFLVLGKKSSEKKVLYPIALYLLIILSATLVGDSISSSPFHYYRLMYFIILMFPLALIFVVKKSTLATVLLAGMALLMIVSATHISPVGPSSMQTFPIQNIGEGRTFVVASYNEESAPHYLQHFLPLKNQIYGIKGLYVESTRNGEYLLNFEKEIDSDGALSWGNFIYHSYLPKNDSLLKEILPAQLGLFQINTIISSEEHAREEWSALGEVARYSTNTKDIVYRAYRVGNASLIEVVKTPLRVVDNASWKEEVLTWFFSSAIREELLVDQRISYIPAEKQDWAEILEQSPRQDFIRFRIHAEHAVPVLIKISYFPNWKAYANGKEIKVYRAAPDLILVYAKGDIELRYESLIIDRMSTWLSLAGLVIFLILCVSFLYPKYKLMD